MPNITPEQVQEALAYLRELSVLDEDESAVSHALATLTTALQQQSEEIARLRRIETGDLKATLLNLVRLHTLLDGAEVLMGDNLDSARRLAPHIVTGTVTLSVPTFCTTDEQVTAYITALKGADSE